MSMRLAGFAGACALALAGLAASARPAAAATPPPTNPFDQPVHPLAVGDRLPDAAYTDQNGRGLRISDLRGRTIIIGFIYTSCRDQCPLLTDKFNRLAAQLPADRFELLEISIDPARDSQAAIANYARAHDVRAPNVRLLIGPAPLVDSFAKPLGVSIVTGGGGELLHSQRTVIAGPDGRIAYFIDDAGWTPVQLVAIARHVDGLPSSGIARLDLELGKAVQAVCGGATAARSGLRDLVAVVAVLFVGGLLALLIGRRLFAP
jgi:protein SCO1/2